MSQTQHAGLASQEVDGTGKGWERGGDREDREGNRKKTGQHLSRRPRGMTRTKTTSNLHVKKGLSLAD